MLGHHSYRGPTTSSALALTGHDRLKVGQAEHTAVSQVVGPRGCKREKPEISIHGERETWWKVHGTNRPGSHSWATLAGGEKGPPPLPPFSLVHFQELLLPRGQSRCSVIFAARMPLNRTGLRTALAHCAEPRARSWEQCPYLAKQGNRLINLGWLCD